LGYVEGQNVALEIRAAEGRLERFPAFAAELARLKVDIILAAGDPAIAAARKATTSIPIVMLGASDPVAAGFVASLARPGGNITGLTSQSSELAGKTLQLLKEAVPNLSRVAILWDPVPGARQTLREMEVAATALELEVQAVEVRSPGELEGAFAVATRNRAGAAVILARTFWSNRVLIAELAVKRRLPTAGMLPAFGEAG
jgi:putative ABC transport system substrate-binding protein